MNPPIDYERCQAFINCHTRPVGGLFSEAGPRRPAVTISRQAGCGAAIVAAKLAAYLDAHEAGEAAPWTIFDRNLVEQVLKDHELPRRLAKFMAEDRISEFSDVIDELCGLHPPSWTLVRQTAETILHLAELGGVILIGRGANIVTRNMDHVLHVRLVGSLEKRIAQIQVSDHLDHDTAARLVSREDRARNRYLRKYFHADINDPMLYHLTVNTDLLSYDQAATALGEIVINTQTQVYSP